MTIVTPAHNEISSRIAKALKLDMKYIKSISLHLDVDSAVFCKVEFYPDITQVDSVTDTLETEMKHYALIELQQKNDFSCCFPC
jgi:hypothetical protein